MSAAASSADAPIPRASAHGKVVQRAAIARVRRRRDPFWGDRLEREFEDCLTLGFWTPGAATSGLSVALRIDRGGYVDRAGILPGCSGQHFAGDGVVHVGISHRLGIDGFVYLSEGHDDLRLRDQAAALERSSAPRAGRMT